MFELQKEKPEVLALRDVSHTQTKQGALSYRGAFENPGMILSFLICKQASWTNSIFDQLSPAFGMRMNWLNCLHSLQVW